jgi:hypothetical protein
MPKVVAVQLPDILRKKSSHLVKLAGKIDSFSLLLRGTPEGELKRSIECQFHNMVFATRKEIRKYCPRYRSLPGEGILDFNTDCASGQLGPDDIGTAPPPKRGRLCETCCFFAGIPEEQASEMPSCDANQKETKAARLNQMFRSGRILGECGVEIGNWKRVSSCSRESIAGR